MEQREFEAVWQSMADKGSIFEARPGVWVPIEAVKQTVDFQRKFKTMVMAGFIFEVKPGQYRVVSVSTGNCHHRFVCSECGAEA